MPQPDIQWSSVNAAFSSQSLQFDRDDFHNPILQQWRRQVYAHVDKFAKPRSFFLELNAGTGIDAVRFASQGHHVHATDLSDGMIAVLSKKVADLSLFEKISIQQISFENLDGVEGKYNYVFSNFGGLNCIKDLTCVAEVLPQLLVPGAYLTWVVMPPVCLWEWAWIIKGKFKKAFRRLGIETRAHLEGEYFTTHYHSLHAVKKALGTSFTLRRVESIGFFSPPPAALSFISRHRLLTKTLSRLSHLVKDRFPFNRCGDHLIVTFQFDAR